MQFYIMSDEDRISISDYTITSTKDMLDSISDSGDQQCQICQLDVCLGHFGLLDLKNYYINPLYEKIYNKYIKNFCKDCEVTYIQEEKMCYLCHRISNYAPGEIILHEKAPFRKFLMKYILVPPLNIRSNEDEEWTTKLSMLYNRLIESLNYGSIKTIQKNLEKIFGTNGSDSLLALLSGKSGIFRKICYGKRLENSARTVITGDPFIDTDEVRIPRKIADKLTMEYTITGEEQDMSRFFISKGVPLTEWHKVKGLKVTKMLSNGDIVLLNRQPTLSYQSILGFRAKIREDDIKTFGIHPSVTKTFNADFDGDEMNIFVFPYSEDMERCRIINFPECINKIQDQKSYEYLGLKSYEELDRHGFTVTLRDIATKEYKGTSLETMIESKAKGSFKNFEQMSSRLGTQYILGEKKGEIDNSYYTGLNMQEYILHQSAAREGIVIQGVSTSGTGYINRKGCHVFADVYKNDRGIIEDNFGYISFP